MRISPLARLALAASLATLPLVFLGAQSGSAIPVKRPVVQVNLKVNEPYYLDAYKADIDRIQTGINAVSAQGVKLQPKDMLGILLDQIDAMLFRQYCDGEGIKVSDADINSQIQQYKSSLGPGATDAMVDASLRRNGVFTDIKTYVKQDLLFSAYLKAKKADEVKAISNPSPADVLKAYDDMKFNLRRPTSCRFSMIRLSIQGKSDDDKKKGADLMKDIADKLKTSPSDFDQYLAKGALDPKGSGYSTALDLVIAKTDESKKQYATLYDAIFKLKPGDVSDLISDETGYMIVRAQDVLPEKQLLLDDPIVGLTTAKAASANPAATVLALVVNDVQTTKYADLQKQTRDTLLSQLRKQATITVSLSSLAGILGDPEVASIKALQGNGGYNLVIQQ